MNPRRRRANERNPVHSMDNAGQTKCNPFNRWAPRGSNPSARFGHQDICSTPDSQQNTTLLELTERLSGIGIIEVAWTENVGVGSSEVSNVHGRSLYASWGFL